MQTAFPLIARDGLALSAADWPAPATPKGLVVLVHGLGEHMGRYPHVIARLHQAGFSVLAYDHRGHGSSPGPRGYIPSFDRMIDDVQSAIDAATARHPGVPVFVYGHSLGGLLVLLTGLQRRPAVRGIVATAPFLRPAFRPARGKVALAILAARLWPTLVMASGLDTKGLSRDPAVERAYLADPLVHDRISSRLGAGLLEGGAWALDHAGQMHIPLLIMHGGADPITSVDASRAFTRASSNGCTLRIWDGLYHEIHNEPEQAAVLDAACEWLTSRLS